MFGNKKGIYLYASDSAARFVQASTEDDTIPGFNEFEHLENFVSVVNMKQCDNTATLVQSENFNYITKIEFCTDGKETNSEDLLMAKKDSK